MNIDLNLLKIFKTVAYYNSISRAAHELCVTQPSVSKSIKKLEEELNTTLFIREKKGMKLTQNGKRIYNYIIEPLNTLENTIDIANNINKIDGGNLKIGASLSVTKYLLIDAIKYFKKKYPNVEITIKNSSSANLYNDLKLGNLDIIFVNSTMNISTSYEKNTICNIEDCFFCSKRYYEKIKNIDDIETFILKNIIIQNVGFDTRNYFIDRCLKNNIKFKPILEVDRNSILVDFVLKDMGVGFATKEFIEEYISNNQIKIIDTDFKIGKRSIVEVHRKNYNNLKFEKLLECIQYYLNKN